MATDTVINFWFCKTATVLALSLFIPQGRKPNHVQFSKPELFSLFSRWTFWGTLAEHWLFVSQGFHWKSEGMYENQYISKRLL